MVIQSTGNRDGLIPKDAVDPDAARKSGEKRLSTRRIARHPRRTSPARTSPHVPYASALCRLRSTTA